MSVMEAQEIGIAVERRRTSNPWQEYAWQPVAVVPPLPGLAPWTLLREEGGVAQFYAGALELELHKSDAASYRYNALCGDPRIYVVLRKDEGEFPYRLLKATAAPDEAQAMAESGEDLVEPVPMPEEILAFVRDFAERHYVEIPFKKRVRLNYDPRKAGFGGGPRGKAREE